MINIQKYLAVLESIKLTTEYDKKILADNVAKMEKLDNLNIDKDAPLSWKYVKYLYNTILTIKRNANFDSEVKEELLSINNMNNLAQGLLSATVFGLTPYVFPGLQTVIVKLYNKGKKTDIKNPSKAIRLERLKESLRGLHEMLLVKVLSGRSGLQFVVMECLAGVFTVLTDPNNNLNEDKQIFQEMLSDFHNNNISSRETYFKGLLLIKGLKGSPKTFYGLSHLELRKQLITPGGFEVFCRTLLTPDDQEHAFESYTIITNILTANGNNVQFYSFIVNEILEFYEKTIYSKTEQRFVPACLDTLNKFHFCNDYAQKEKIENYFTSLLVTMITPQETLAGTILMDQKQLEMQIFKIYNAFTNTLGIPLNTGILKPYFHVLFTMYCQINREHVLSSYLLKILNTFFGQRNKNELGEIVKSVLFGESVGVIQKMHENVALKFDESSNSYSVQINHNADYHDSSNNLIHILKNSNNNLLIYNIFMELLTILDEANATFTQTKSDLMDTDVSEDDITGLLSKKFFKRFVIIETLSNLINYKKFHSQFRDNRRDLVDFLNNMLKKRIAQKHDESDNEVIVIILTLFRELQQYLDTTDMENDLLKLLNNYKEINTNSEVQKQIDLIFQEYNNFSKRSTVEKSVYKMAIGMLCESEAFCKVYGSTQLIKLLREGDEETLANKHTILVLAMTNLRDIESYAYLNTVKLIVALSDVLETVIIESLNIDFKNEELDIDYRLKLGEVLVEVVRHLAGLAYQYKDTLLHSFLANCNNSSDEFRTSCLSNLANLCSILSYQVQNNFQEIFVIIQSTIQLDKYLPARRAAVFILSQLLVGINNLLDFEEILLPIYRLLKHVLATETDMTTKMHAAIGLEKLQEKTKLFLLPEQLMQKEIKIFEVKSQSNNVKFK